MRTLWAAFISVAIAASAAAENVAIDENQARGVLFLWRGEPFDERCVLVTAGHVIGGEYLSSTIEGVPFRATRRFDDRMPRTDGDLAGVDSIAFAPLDGNPGLCSQEWPGIDEDELEEVLHRPRKEDQSLALRLGSDDVLVREVEPRPGSSMLLLEMTDGSQTPRVGMSGAGVYSGDILVAIVVHVDERGAPREQPRIVALTVERVTELVSQLTQGRTRSPPIEERGSFDVPPLIDALMVGGLTTCDDLAARPGDPQRHPAAQGEYFDELRFEEAIESCEAAVDDAGPIDEARLRYQLGRAYEAAYVRDPNRQVKDSDVLDPLQRALVLGHRQAIFNIRAFLLNENRTCRTDGNCDELYERRLEDLERSDPTYANYMRADFWANYAQDQGRCPAPADCLSRAVRLLDRVIGDPQLGALALAERLSLTFDTSNCATDRDCLQRTVAAYQEAGQSWTRARGVLLIDHGVTAGLCASPRDCMRVGLVLLEAVRPNDSDAVAWLAYYHLRDSAPDLIGCPAIGEGSCRDLGIALLDEGVGRGSDWAANMYADELLDQVWEGSCEPTADCLRKAIDVLKPARARGSQDAMRELADIHDDWRREVDDEGGPVLDCPSEGEGSCVSLARGYYEEAAADGSVWAMRRLVRLFINGGHADLCTTEEECLASAKPHLLDARADDDAEMLGLRASLAYHYPNAFPELCEGAPTCQAAAEALMRRAAEGGDYDSAYQLFSGCPEIACVLPYAAFLRGEAAEGDLQQTGELAEMLPMLAGSSFCPSLEACELELIGFYASGAETIRETWHLEEWRYILDEVLLREVERGRTQGSACAIAESPCGDLAAAWIAAYEEAGAPGLGSAPAWTDSASMDWVCGSRMADCYGFRDRHLVPETSNFGDVVRPAADAILAGLRIAPGQFAAGEPPVLRNAARLGDSEASAALILGGASDVPLCSDRAGECSATSVFAFVYCGQDSITWRTIGARSERSIAELMAFLPGIVALAEPACMLHWADSLLWGASNDWRGDELSMEQRQLVMDLLVDATRAELQDLADNGGFAVSEVPEEHFWNLFRHVECGCFIEVPAEVRARLLYATLALTPRFDENSLLRRLLSVDALKVETVRAFQALVAAEQDGSFGKATSSRFLAASGCRAASEWDAPPAPVWDDTAQLVVVEPVVVVVEAEPTFPSGEDYHPMPAFIQVELPLTQAQLDVLPNAVLDVPVIIEPVTACKDIGVALSALDVIASQVDAIVSP